MVERFPILLFLALVTTSCMSTTVVFDAKWKPHTKPAYVDYFDSYLGGFIGHESVNLGKVCLDQKIHALRKFKSWEDGFLTALTVGIYSPTTVSVWCGE